MKLFQRITLALMGCMLLSTPAMAADYSFETKAPADYYGSTAYEEVMALSTITAARMRWIF